METIIEFFHSLRVNHATITDYRMRDWRLSSAGRWSDSHVYTADIIDDRPPFHLNAISFSSFATRKYIVMKFACIPDVACCSWDTVFILLSRILLLGLLLLCTRQNKAYGLKYCMQNVDYDCSDDHTLIWQWLERQPPHFTFRGLQKAFETEHGLSPWCLLLQSWCVCQSLRPGQPPAADSSRLQSRWRQERCDCWPDH